MTTATVNLPCLYYPSYQDINGPPAVDLLTQYDPLQAMAATVAYVRNQTLADVMVIDHAGAQHFRDFVPLLQFGAGAVPTPYAQLQS